MLNKMQSFVNEILLINILYQRILIILSSLSEKDSEQSL